MSDSAGLKDRGPHDLFGGVRCTIVWVQGWWMGVNSEKCLKWDGGVGKGRTSW